MAQIIITKTGVFYGTLVFEVNNALGDNFVIRCPFHEGRDPSVEVNYQKDTYHCHFCGRKGVFSELVVDQIQKKVRTQIEKGQSLGTDDKNPSG
jgi:hypothetical protein